MKRNISKHDGKSISTHRVKFNITRNIRLLLKARNPRQVFLNAWLEILNELEKRISKVTIIKVNWKFIEEGWIKYNTNGAFMSNPGVTSYAFFSRDKIGDLYMHKVLR